MPVENQPPTEQKYRVLTGGLPVTLLDNIFAGVRSFFFTDKDNQNRIPQLN
jgi:hypothetical protein